MRVAKLWGEFEGPGWQNKSTLAHKRPLEGAFHFIVFGRWRRCRSNGYSRGRRGNGRRDHEWVGCRRMSLQGTQLPFALRDVGRLVRAVALQLRAAPCLG